jgi:hypothetical protein
VKEGIHHSRLIDMFDLIKREIITPFIDLNFPLVLH